MCMIDMGDYDSNGFTQVINRKAARVEHECDECRRTIHKGEPYQQINNRYEDRFSRYHTCEQCVAAATWLQVTCSGYLFQGVLEDLEQHWDESHEFRSMWLGRAIAGMRNRWASKISGKLTAPLRPWTVMDVPFRHRTNFDKRSTYASGALNLRGETLFTEHPYNTNFQVEGGI